MAQHLKCDCTRMLAVMNDLDRTLSPTNANGQLTDNALIAASIGALQCAPIYCVN